MSQSKVTAEVIINRPSEEIFAFIKDMNNHTNWQTGVIESHVTSDGGVEVMFDLPLCHPNAGQANSDRRRSNQLRPD